MVTAAADSRSGAAPLRRGRATCATRTTIMALVAGQIDRRTPARRRPPFEVYVNGVRQERGVDYEVARRRAASSRPS